MTGERRMKQLIGIIGGRSQNTSEEACRLAEAIGAEIGQRGFGLICGGGDGIMEAACRGCKQADGITLGVLKWNHNQDANPYIDIAIPTSMDLARNNIIVWSACGVIALEGNYGTTSEISLALDIEKPLIVVGDNFLLKENVFETSNSCTRILGNDSRNAGSILDTLLLMVKKDNPNKFARHV